MERLTVEGVLGRPVDVDVCRTCRAFWFEPFETVHLTAASTIQLFKIISEQPTATSFPTRSYCPKCDAPLLLTHDRQRNTAFTYWRCDHGHGRFTPFVDFLREKDFIHPLTPLEMAELRQKVQEIHCSNCGAPIDLAHDSTCSHCGSPIAMIDMNKVADLAHQSGKPAAAARVPPPATMLIPADYVSAGSTTFGGTLIDIGLDVISDWLMNLIE
jgi:hypothetical protein